MALFAKKILVTWNGRPYLANNNAIVPAEAATMPGIVPVVINETGEGVYANFYGMTPANPINTTWNAHPLAVIVGLLAIFWYFHKHHKGSGSSSGGGSAPTFA